MAFLTFFFIVSFLCVLTLWKRFITSRRHKIPPGLKELPGPKGYPIVGSVPEVPEKNSFIKFADWGKEYGPIYQVDLAGSNHVWISSDQISRDLLAKKGAIYSDRPHIPALISDNRTSSQYLPLLSKNDGWTRQRKFANVIMRESEKALFHRYPELEAKRMLVELMDDPTRYNHALESFISRVTCRLAWGHSDASDELKQRARELLIGVSPTGALGNKLPFLMSLPDWLVPAKAWERRRAATERKFFETMQSQVEADIREKKAPQSWMRTFLDNRSKWGFQYELEGAYAVGMHGIAGALTIAAPMQTFCLAMCFYPQYLPMLQEELDRVCGDRLPRAEDRPNLPFTRAIIRECLRWRPPVPTGIPHYLTQDDEWNGYHIPKGSTMHPLEWAIARDPAMFPDPETFNPLRWVEPGWPSYQEPLTQFPTIINSTQFGYGRRICQGQGVADEDLLIGIASIGWLFNIDRIPESMPPSASGPSPATDSEKIEHFGVGMNEKASISSEELNTGIESKDAAPTMEDVILSKYTYPGAYPEEGAKEEKTQKVRSRLDSANSQAEKPTEKPKQEKAKNLLDPTLDFTTLLIAKPLPFRFNLSVRHDKRDRAQKVRELFTEALNNGDYKESREFWGENQGKDKPLGWGKVLDGVEGTLLICFSIWNKTTRSYFKRVFRLDIGMAGALGEYCSGGWAFTGRPFIISTPMGHTHHPKTLTSGCNPSPLKTLAVLWRRRFLDDPFQLCDSSTSSTMLGFTASRCQICAYLFGVALFSISFLVFLNSSISFVITQRIGQDRNVGDAVGTLGFADELVALIACPAWGLLSDRVGVRSVAVLGYTIVGLSLYVFVQAKNIYPQLLLARLLFSLGATATATMVTAILPTMTIANTLHDPRSPTRGANGPSHTMAASISSELTITPARFRSRSPTIDNHPKKDTGASTSQLAGLVGMFTGCGALVALLIFLPLPTRFQRAGASPAMAVADSFYAVGAVAILVALGCFFGLRSLPGEEGKGWSRLVSIKSDKASETVSSDRPILPYPRLFLTSIELAFRSRNIGLGYLGGFVARASSVGISLFIPLFVNAYFLRTGKCSVADPSDPTDIKDACPRAYTLAAALTGVSQLVALLSAPLFGYLSGRFRKFNVPLLIAALSGIIGYSAFGSLKSPDPESEGGTGAVFFIVALLGISQIGAIVCSLALLGRGIQNDKVENAESDSTETATNGTSHPSAGATPPITPPITPATEDAPLLGRSHNPSRPSSPSNPQTHNHLKGSIAGTYSLLGGFGILLLTKAGGALFDTSGPGAPFFMMASFNALLLVVGLGVGVWEITQGWKKREDI
ncbi:cytochrome P450 [Lindgomyces ingoldianus]|uniref:Cytochrome P450 n=1 Tax=Lindgomyces ingoldianus TaxID=673940 RepID=A0ACB6RDJ3_9PLEO|nr:cytochrome P450 [Lindgomyces ingoldianus]KAF2477324.1 cytochrome P450 [Lindgomyces ingoldianus]